MAENEFCEVSVRVISQKGTCEAGHKVGDEFRVVDKTPAGICPWAFYSLFPFLSALAFGGSFPWEKDKDTATVACPDPTNPVVFELRRIRQ